MKYPNLKEERKLWKQGYKWVVGLDEAGRGPLAGPVVAAAVVIKLKVKSQKLKVLENVKDSKKLTPQKREKLYNLLTSNPQVKWGIGKVSEKVIDKINILEATKLAMEKAIGNLNVKIQNPNAKSNPKSKCPISRINYLIIDGNMKLNIDIPQKAIIKADEKVFSCAAASILAKVSRDRIMLKYHKKYPCYDFNKHKGYCTRGHVKKLKKYGPCALHRKTFFPIIMF